MAMENGAADYLDKAVDLEGNLLGHAIQFAIAREQGKNKEKQLKEERRIHETSLKSVIKNNSDPMLILDKDGTIISANMVYLSLLGQSPKKLNGQKFKYSLHPDKTSEIKFKHKNGKNSWLNVHISEILWNNEKAYLAHFFDRRMRHLIQQNG
jgi:PAS domain-containing protein